MTIEITAPTDSADTAGSSIKIEPTFAVFDPLGSVPVRLRVNADDHDVVVEPWTTLLDALRERLRFTGTKKGCDHGACGACTVMVDGRRVLACLTLALTVRRNEITTIEGLGGSDGRLHPMQRAFAEHDALQCGYCTPGQVVSAVAMLAEVDQGRPSAATDPGRGFAGRVDLDEHEIRERMSGWAFSPATCQPRSSGATRLSPSTAPTC